LSATHEPWNTDDAVALFAAVLYHGLIAMSDQAKPARTETVIETATKFKNHLNGEKK
jgi:hypothetical protein